MQTGNGAHRTYRFGEFELDLDRGALTRAGQDVPLRPKSFAVLTYLVESHGRLVSKRALLDAIWGHVYVTEGSLTQCLIDVRRALGDEDHEIVRTVPRRGFIFELPVTLSGSEPGPEPGENPVARATRRRLMVLSALLVVVAVAAGWWTLAYRGVDVPLAEVVRSSAPANSIAVLPFEDMSPGGDQEYFGDGIAEELLHALTQIPGLLVSARTSSFSFKGMNPDIPTVASKLNVAHVLEGSVRKSGDRFRITAQLVDAKSNTHLWSKTYERELGDIFAIQSEIARAVADTLRLTLSERQAAEIMPKHDPVAYEHYLQGRFFWHRRGPGDVERAERHYARAVELDPGLARAWVGMATVANAGLAFGMLPLEEAMQIKRDALERALALDPGLAEAHVRIARYYFRSNDRPKADRHWARGVELGRESPEVLAIAAGWALWRGELDEAVALQRRAVVLDPLSAVARVNLGAYLTGVGRLDEAEAEILKAIELSPRAGDPNNRQAGGGVEAELALVLILQGRHDEAFEWIGRQPPGPVRDRNLALFYTAKGRENDFRAVLGRLLDGSGIENGIRLAEVLAYRGESGEALDLLETTFGRVDPARWSPDWRFVQFLRNSPLLVPLRSDPRWEALWEPWHDHDRM